MVKLKTLSTQEIYGFAIYLSYLFLRINLAVCLLFGITLSLETLSHKRKDSFLCSFECLRPQCDCSSLLGRVLNISHVQPSVLRISLLRKQMFLKHEEKTRGFKTWFNKGQNRVRTRWASNLSRALWKDRHCAKWTACRRGMPWSSSGQSSTATSPGPGKWFQPLLEALSLALKWAHQTCFAALSWGLYVNEAAI